MIRAGGSCPCCPCASGAPGLYMAFLTAKFFIISGRSLWSMVAKLLADKQKADQILSINRTRTRSRKSICFRDIPEPILEWSWKSGMSSWKFKSVVNFLAFACFFCRRILFIYLSNFKEKFNLNPLFMKDIL